MKKAEYIRKINKSSLIIIPENNCGTDRDSIEMFHYNHIPYFLKMGEQRKDVHLQFCYDITSMRSLEQLLEYKLLDYRLIQMILNSFDQACIQTEDYMMTENDILLEPEFIFMDHNLEQISYCYLPGNQKDICMQFKGFMEYLLQHIDHKDEQAVQLAYGVYQRVVEERTGLHNVLKDKEHLKNLYQNTVSDQMSVRKNLYQKIAPERIHADQENERQSLISQENERQSLVSQENERQLSDGQELENRRKSSVSQESENDGMVFDGQEVEKSIYHTQCFRTAKESRWFHPDTAEQGQLQQDSLEMPLSKTEQKKNEKALKGKLKKAEQIQQSVLTHNTDQVSKIQQKETLRKQAAEKLKNMLRKKIYTDRARYTEENTVFEADEDEPVFSNPTVCLMSETDGIQNQFVYQGADRSRDFQCMQGKLLLGSDMEESDIYIPFPMISRVHARIEIDVQGTFLEDMNSTNGTHVNGELLQYRERRMLQKGDIISLAGECYSFH